MNKKAHSTALVAGIVLLILSLISLTDYLKYGASVIQSGLYLEIGIPQSIFWFGTFFSAILVGIGLIANKRFCVGGWVLRALFTAAPSLLSVAVLVSRAGLSRIGNFLLSNLPGLLSALAMVFAAVLCSRLMAKQKANGIVSVLLAVAAVVLPRILSIRMGMAPAHAMQQLLSAGTILNLGVYILLAIAGSKGAEAEEQVPTFQSNPQPVRHKQVPTLSGEALARAQEELSYYEGLVNKGILSEEDLAQKKRELGL